LQQGVDEFLTYIQNNGDYIPNYGELYRCGETISTSFVESTVNYVVSKRFVKKQAMQWSPRGAHLLLQTRTKVLNEELEDTFRQWYPAFRPTLLPRAAKFIAPFAPGNLRSPPGAPTPRVRQSTDPPAPGHVGNTGAVQQHQRLDGMLNYYYRTAA
jgi:hypothetical protein